MFSRLIERLAYFKGPILSQEYRDLCSNVFYPHITISQLSGTETFTPWRVQDGEHMYTCGGFILIFGKTNTIM